ncbi:MAG: protein TolR [Alphaproteobacteria bacterium]|jgi:biopolymer transport protein TolR|nr:protein TolR [Alphaproteobacteria bacterium]
MAFSINGGGGKAKRQTYEPMAEINVTPFVDVMLVLLVVFMITAPLLTIGVPVDLPKTEANMIEGSDEPLTITIDAAGKIFLQEAEVTLEDLVPRLNAVTEARGGDQGRIFVRGDRTIDYGAVMRVMGTINAAGYKRVALIAERPRGQVAN